ncbi:MAG: hypothetical protein U0003_05525 [Vampirovibrionales bacterium]
MRRRPLSSHRGVVAILLAGTLSILLVTVGVAAYTGIVTYIQSDMQHLANSMALAGARSLFDDLNPEDLATPKANSGKATAAATAVFERVREQHPVLAVNFNLSNAGIVVNEGEQTVYAHLKANMKTPFLSFVGIQDVKLSAEAKAVHGQLDGKKDVIGIAPNAQNITSGFKFPVLDGDGADVFIDTGTAASGGYHGVHVELCTNDGGVVCHNVDYAARVYNKTDGGIRVVRNAGGGEIGRVLYGKVFIDMSVAGFRKASGIRFTDDGVHDAITGTTEDGSSVGRKLEIQPANTTIAQIWLLHYATLCPFANGTCTPPAPDFRAAPSSY